MSFEARVWTTKEVNDFPDSSFAYIEPGGTKDSEGKTTPRSLRHLPYKDENGKVDFNHVRNALSRLNQTQAIPAKTKDTIRKKLTNILQKAQPEQKSMLEDSVAFYSWQVEAQKNFRKALGLS
jgi:hypothetical protein